MGILENVRYLEKQDFTSNGDLKKYVNEGKPAIIMCQGNFCGFCNLAKPAFQDLSYSNTNVQCCSIQIDGEETERDASKLISKWDKNYRGVPFYIGFNSDGKYAKTHTGGRDKKSLEEFVNTLN